MKLGIFGGTFDPIHYGHLLLAETAREQCELDEVRILPAYLPPHKTSQQISSGKQRTEMISFAISGFPEFSIDRRELKQEQTCYTVDTLTKLSSEFPDAELHFLMGADSLIDLPTWREPEKIASLSKIVAVNRDGTSREDLLRIVEQLPEPIQQSVILLEMPSVGISASDLRSRISEKRSIRFLTPRPVERYILEHRLYEV